MPSALTIYISMTHSTALAECGSLRIDADQKTKKINKFKEITNA